MLELANVSLDELCLAAIPKHVWYPAGEHPGFLDASINTLDQPLSFEDACFYVELSYFRWQSFDWYGLFQLISLQAIAITWYILRFLTIWDFLYQL
jgi:hypothetical protein